MHSLAFRTVTSRYRGNGETRKNKINGINGISSSDCGHCGAGYDLAGGCGGSPSANYRLILQGPILEGILGVTSGVA